MARHRDYPAKRGKVSRGQRTEDVGLVSLPAPPPQVLARPNPMTEDDFEGWLDPYTDIRQALQRIEDAPPSGPGDMVVTLPPDLTVKVAEAARIEESSTVSWEVLRDRVMARPPEGSTITNTARIGHRLKELGVRPRVFTIRGEKYLSIPLKELTIAEGGTWTAPDTTKPTRKTSRKDKK